MCENNKRVQILLSTYNGEQYLREQLNSLLSLDNLDIIKVLIRDDGSQDGTIKILEEFEKRYGFEVIRGKNIGLNNSFFELYQLADRECEYFATCDQDDVWLKDKIARAVSTLDKYSKEQPLLYATTSLVADHELNPIGLTAVPKKDLSFYNAMTQNLLPGHTQVFNRCALDLLKKPKLLSIYDWWIYLLVSATGTVIFEKEPSVVYRQHGNNVVGCEKNKIKLLLARCRRCLRNDNEIGKQLKGFYMSYQKEIPNVYRKELKSFLEHQSSLKKRFIYIFISKIYRQTIIETLIFKCLYLLGKYNI